MKTNALCKLIAKKIVRSREASPASGEKRNIVHARIVRISAAPKGTGFITIFGTRWVPHSPGRRPELELL